MRGWRTALVAKASADVRVALVRHVRVNKPGISAGPPNSFARWFVSSFLKRAFFSDGESKMFIDYAGIGAALASLAEAKRDAERWKEAGDDPLKIRALSNFERERSQRRHEMAVVRASAPVTNITIRNYW